MLFTWLYSFLIVATPQLWQFKRSQNPHQPDYQPFFSNNLGVNFEFEFCNNIEDKFNGGMSRITYYVALHVYLKGSQMLLTFNRLQLMYSVSFYCTLIRSCIYRALSHTTAQLGTRSSTSFLSLPGLFWINASFQIVQL